jgi:hypothetical protein
MSFKTELQDLDDMIIFFEGMVKDYPDNEAYDHTLNLLYKQRAELANTIGKDHD